MKNSVVVVIVLFLTLFLTRVYIQPGVPQTHDGENHLARFAQYKWALKEGQFPPRFAPYLLNGYGYPVFNYNYPLANILSLPFSVLKFSYEVTFKLLVIFSVLGGLWGVKKWLQALGFSFQTQLVGLLAFAALPYLTNSILIRGNIGEIMALALLPWLFWSIERIFVGELPLSKGTWLGVVGIYTAFVLSHNVAAVFALPLLVAYVILHRQFEKHRWLTWMGLWSIAVMNSLWFWLPALAEKSQVVVDAADISKGVVQHFPTFQQLLFSPVVFGFSYLGAIDSLSFQVGLIHVFALIMMTVWSLQWLIRHRQFSVQSDQKQKIVWWGVIGLGWMLLILQIDFTQELWKFFSVTRFMQFPWRLTLFWSVLIITVVAYVFEKTAFTFKVMLIVGLCWQLAALGRTQVLGMMHKDNLEYDRFTQTTSTSNENLPKSFTFVPTGERRPEPQILDGTGTIEIKKWTGSSHEYKATISQGTTIVEPTANFLGWQTDVVSSSNPRPLRLTYINDEFIGGRIAFQLSPGEYWVRTRFTQRTWARLVGNTDSLLAIVSTLMWGVWRDKLVGRVKKQ